MPHVQRTLARVALELLDRSERILAHLEELQKLDRKEHEGVIAGVRNALGKYTDYARDVLLGPKKTGLFGSGAHSQLKSLSYYFYLAHELLTLLPTPDISPEMFAVLRSTGDIARQHPAVVLGTAFNAYEFDFVEKIIPQTAFEKELREHFEKTPFFQLALCDRHAPTAWALLGHELGHAIDHAAHVCERLKPQLAPYKELWDLPKPVFDDVVTELWCDLVGAYVFGPCTILAVLSMEYCLLFQREKPWSTPVIGSVHPPVAWRLRVVHEYLSATGAPVDLLANERTAWDAAVALHEQNAPAMGVPGDAERFAACIAPTIPILRAELTTAGLAPSSVDPQVLERATRRLRSHLPVAAHGLSRKALREEVRAYRWEHQVTPAYPAFKQLAARFQEVPTSIPVVLYAGHAVRQETLRTASQTGVLEPDHVTQVLSDLTHNEGLIETSLVATEVHHRLLKKLKLPTAPPTPSTVAPAPALRHARRSLLLSDIEILERTVAEDDDLLFISPFIDARQVGPASFDVRLGTEICVTRTTRSSHINLGGSGKKAQQDVERYFTRHRIGASDTFILHPGQFALASTLEYVRLPHDLAARLEGRSTPARVGLQVHATAGFIDPGFEGTLTFELSNAGNVPLEFRPGYRLGQLCFFPVAEVQVPYASKERSKYSRSIGVKLPRFDIEPELAEDTEDEQAAVVTVE